METKNSKKEQTGVKHKVKPFNWKRVKKNNLASLLVTQVPYGQSRPFASPLINFDAYVSSKESIVLGEQKEKDKGKKTLVLDLDETLVHSSFQPVAGWDLVLPVEIEGQIWYVYVLKRPGVDLFLKKMAIYYEIVIYTASLAKYADPLLDWLDPSGLWTYRLFREDCTFYGGIFVKNLSRLSRNLKDTIIIDNSPASYLMHPEWALPITSWYDNMDDTELYLLTPILEWLSKVDDVRVALKSIVFEDKVLFNKASQVLQGGKIGERSHSQQPHLRNIKAADSEVEINQNSNIQSGDISQEKQESESINKNIETKAPAASYFKSYQSVNRKSRTSNLNDKNRGGSQKRNLVEEQNKIHFMPLVDSTRSKPLNVDTVKNGWINKTEKENYASLVESSKKIEK